MPPLVTGVDAKSWLQNGKDWEGKNTCEIMNICLLLGVGMIASRLSDVGGEFVG